VLEAEAQKAGDLERVCRDVAVAVSREHGVIVAAVVLIAARSLLKTSSGKVQRRAMRRAFESQELRVLAEWRLRTGFRVIG
jgi:acyl-coenzyme A synthetase/AMP-(fatty) acid ligase